MTAERSLGMHIKPGYKQTEVGVIPEDWGVYKLGSLLLGAPTYGINAPAIEYDTRYPTYLRITDISENGKFIQESKASVNHVDSDKYILNIEELVFARTGASVGKSYIYDPPDGRLVFAGFLIRIQPDGKKLSAKFLKFYTQTKQYWNWIVTNSMRSGQPGINGKEYASLIVSLPPIAEQQAIADCLSDADGLIESLEQLIAKKRQIKQGAMQELLTGKRRLPGFSSVSCRGDLLVAPTGYKQTELGMIPQDWNTIPIGSLCNISAGSDLVKEDFSSAMDERYPFPIYSNAITNKGLYGYSKSYQYEPDSITVTARGEIGYAIYRTKQFCAIGRLLILTSIYPCDLRIVAEYINNFVDFASENTGVPQLTVPQIAKYFVAIPLNKAEQTAIANVLSDIDSELTALETKLEKARKIKQGMMHELLTGSIRLV